MSIYIYTRTHTEIFGIIMLIFVSIAKRKPALMDCEQFSF